MGIEAKHSYRFVYLKSEKWQNVRIEALAREKGRCQICGEESISNDAHHIWYPESIWETTSDHLVILCRPCHDFLHTMVPEAKTKDEDEGRNHWLKFTNAIVAWRRQKLELFTDDGFIPTSFANPSELRTELKRLKGIIKNQPIATTDTVKRSVIVLFNRIKDMLDDFSNGLK